MLYALIAALVGLVTIFLGVSVAPCLGLTPETRAPCVEAWQAQKGVLQRLYEGLGPGPFAVGTFVALVLATIGLDRWRDAR